MNLADVLACYRLTKLVIDDEITRPLRDRIFERYDPDAGSKIGYLITCPWCVSVYAGAAIVAARRIVPRSWAPVADALALSAATGILASREP